MSGIFDEKSMVYALERNLPGGEKVSAGKIKREQKRNE